MGAKLNRGDLKGPHDHLGKSKERIGSWVLRSLPLTLYGVHGVGLQASEVFGCCFAHLAVKKFVHSFPASLA